MSEKKDVKKTKRFDAYSILALAGIVLIAIFFVILFTTMNASGTVSSSSSSSSSASTSSSVASALLLAQTSTAGISYLFVPINVVNITFMAITLLVLILLFVDLSFHKKSSHIAMVLLMGFLVSAYLLTRTIFCLSILGNAYINAGILYLIAFVASLFQIYFFIMKALDGDADWKYGLATGLTIAFIFLASVINYSLLDTYNYLGVTVFWLGLLASRVMVFVEIIAVVISTHYDYDPHPILLDDFGNPVNAKKSEQTNRSSMTKK